MKTLKTIGFVLSGVLLILSGAVIYMTWSTKMVPTLYIAIAAVVLFGFTIGVFCLAKLRSKKTRILSIFISIMLIILLSVASFYLYKTNKAMDTVTGKNIQTDEINVYVKSDDAVNSINEAVSNGYKFGIINLDDMKHINETIDKVQQSVGTTITTESYDSINEMIGAFEGGYIQSIITSKGTLEMVDATEEHADFSKGLKVIMENKITEEIVEEVKKDVDKDRFCVYFSGIDSFGSVNVKSRSDVNIIAVVNNATKQVLLVSTPRDYYIELGGPGGKMDKLTHAGLYGIDSSTKTLANLYGTDIGYYVRLNFSGFQQIIDQIGGIDVNSEYAFTSITEEGTYSYNVGVNHLNGEEALGFARARYAFQDGDRQRGRNQMQVIKATIEKLESPETLANYSAIMDQLGGLFQTDMSKDNIGYLVKSTLDNGGWSVLTYSVSGYDASKVCYSLGFEAYVMEPNPNDVQYGKDLINRVLAGETLTQDEINVYIEGKDKEDQATEEKPADEAPAEDTTE